MQQWTWKCRYLFKILIFVSVGYVPRSGTAESYVGFILRLFLETSILFFIVVVPIYSPTNSTKRVPFLYILINTYSQLFYKSHLNAWSDILWFWFSFPSWLAMLSTLSGSLQFSSVTESCLTFCDPMDCSMPGFPVLHHLWELAQTHVPWVGDAIKPSFPLPPPSPFAYNLSQNKGLFQWVGSSPQEAKVLKPQHQSFQWIFRVDFL